MNTKEKVIAAAVAAGAVVVAMRYMSKKVGEAAQAVNPVNRENIFHRGANAVGDVFDNGSTDDSFNLGVSIWEFMNPEQVRREQEMLGAVGPSAVEVSQ